LYRSEGNGGTTETFQTPVCVHIKGRMNWISFRQSTWYEAIGASLEAQRGFGVHLGPFRTRRRRAYAAKFAAKRYCLFHFCRGKHRASSSPARTARSNFLYLNARASLRIRNFLN
jgi:hypothetical protein